MHLTRSLTTSATLILLTTALILASIPARAQTTNTNSSYSSYHRENRSDDNDRNYNNRREGELTPLSGFYGGAFGGYSWTDADTDTAGNLDVNGGDFGLFLGYQLDAFLDRTLGLGINGALEAYFAWSNADDDNSGVDVEKDHEWGVSFRPGLSFVDNVMPLGIKPYGIIGYRRTSFDASGSLGGDDDYNGFELGVGTELVAYDNYGVRLDYSHVWYGDKGDVDPDENDLRLGVAYHF